MDVRQPWFVAGFLCGGLVAAATVLLTIPRSGRELRQAAVDHFKQAREDARVAGREAEADVLSRYRHLRSATVDTQLGVAPPETMAPRPAPPAAS